MKKLNGKKLATAAAFLTVFLATPAAASGLYYGYGRINVDYQWYHGARESNLGMTVHEFAFVDSSGSFRAAMETQGNRIAAEGDARSEEERKIRNYESFGGRPITYSYEQAMAREGDAKRYHIRLGSDEGFSMQSLTGGKKGEHLLAYGEIGMSAPLWGDVLMEGETLALRHGVGIGVHWGSLKHYGRPGADQVETDRDGGYFYIPVTYNLAAFTPWGIGFVAEAGIDPITATRIATGNEDLKQDRVYRGALEYRYAEFSGGLRIEDYSGCFTKSERKSINNPEYKHQMIGVYLAAGM